MGGHVQRNGAFERPLDKSPIAPAIRREQPPHPPETRYAATGAGGPEAVPAVIIKRRVTVMLK